MIKNTPLKWRKKKVTSHRKGSKTLQCAIPSLSFNPKWCNRRDTQAARSSICPIAYDIPLIFRSMQSLVIVLRNLKKESTRHINNSEKKKKRKKEKRNEATAHLIQMVHLRFHPKKTNLKQSLNRNKGELTCILALWEQQESKSIGQFLTAPHKLNAEPEKCFYVTNDYLCIA